MGELADQRIDLPERERRRRAGARGSGGRSGSSGRRSSSAAAQASSTRRTPCFLHEREHAEDAAHADLAVLRDGSSAQTRADVRARRARARASSWSVGRRRPRRAILVAHAMAAALLPRRARAAAARSSDRAGARAARPTAPRTLRPEPARAARGSRRPRPRRSRRGARCARRTRSSGTARPAAAAGAGFSSANIAATWRFVVPWMRVSAQALSQRSRYACASSSVSKRRPRSGVRCAWPTPDSTLPLRSGWRTRHGSATTP